MATLYRLSFSGSGISGAICVLTVLTLVPTSARADKGDLYIGGGPAFSILDPETGGTIFSVDDDTDIGGKVFLGYDFTRHWSLEGFFSVPGEAGIAPMGTIEYDSLWGFGGLFSWPHNRRGLSGFVKAGGTGGETSSSNVPFEEVNDGQLLLGAGGRYNFANGWGARLEYEHFFGDVQLITLSVVKRFNLFGGTAAAQPESVVQTEPEPEPPKVLDSDGDGVADDKDDCPDTLTGLPVDAHGCPQYEGTLPRVLFALRSAVLDETARNRLDAVAEILQRYPTLQLTVLGHTCNVGTEAYNQKLSERRAQSVVDYLIEKGVPRDRLQARGMGELQPIASNATEEGRARNRRSEFEVLGK